jgi:hypothetical protein
VATATDELTYFSFPIAKFEKNDEGDLVVYGKATDGSVDSDEQIVDPAWSAKALQEWHNNGEGGNVRVQHQRLRDPAGRSISIDIDKDGDSGHWVKSLIVEPVAKRLVEKGVLRAYSVGIARPVIRRDPSGKARGGIVAGGSLAEISLVDRPANKACGLVLAKSENGAMRLVGEQGELWGDPEYLARVRDDPDFLAKAEPDAGEPGVAKQGAEHQGDTAGEPAAQTPAPAPAGGGADGSGPEDSGADEADVTQPDDTDGGADAISKAGEATRAAYRAERREWLAREPAVKSAVGGTEYLQRRADWMRWDAEGRDEGLDGTREGAMLWLAKHGQEPAAAMDPDAGYLTAEAGLYKRDVSAEERRQLASRGHALPDGSYPIATVSDLHNAAHLARSGHGDAGAARRLIARRAKDLGVTNPLASEGQGKGAGADEAAATAAGAGKDAEPGAVKGSKDCTNCGKSYDSDTNVVNCENCGRKLPAAGKAARTPEAVKGSRDCGNCGKSYDADAAVRYCGNCGSKLPAGKSEDPALLELAATVAKSVAAGLITQAAGDEIIASAAKASRPLPGDTKPAGTHREPDGTSTVEQLEPQAGLPTDPDKTPDEVPPSVAAHAGKAGDVPYSLWRMHDATCAAYDARSVFRAYPSLETVADAVRPDWLAAQAASAAEKGKAKKAARLAALTEAALALKGMDADAIGDARAELSKAFSDMYPDTRLRPGAAPKPGQYQRPYLSAGHASEHPSGSASIPPSARVPSPEQFRRPIITDGHEADSPANKEAGDIRNDAPVRSGAARTYYTNAQREAARVAMQAIHDHIAGNFPDMCPMASSKSVMPPDMGAHNVPHPHGAGDQGGVASAKAVDPEAQASQLITDAIRRHAERVTSGPLGPITPAPVAKAEDLEPRRWEHPVGGLNCPGCGASLAKSANPAPSGADLARDDARPAVGLTVEQVKSLLTETFDPYADRFEQLQKQIDDVAARPDPAMAPVRGAFARPAPAAPVERRSLVDEAASAAREAAEKAAAAEAAQYRDYITTLTRSPDPQTRERAITVLNKLSAGG